MSMRMSGRGFHFQAHSQILLPPVGARSSVSLLLRRLRPETICAPGLTTKVELKVPLSGAMKNVNNF